MAPKDKDSNDSPDLNDLISLSEASEISGLSPSFVRRLVSTGKIWGMKVGRNWVTTEREILDYLSQDRKRGPKPQ